MLGADFAFHLLAKRNDIAVGNNAHFVGFLDATRFIFGGIAGFRTGGNVVDLRRSGVEAVGFDTQKIASALSTLSRVSKCGWMVGSPPVMMMLRAV